MMLISLSVRDVEVEDTSVSAQVQAQTLLTKEMRNLIEHGVSIEFELYNSLLLEGEEGKTLYQIRIFRTVSYDYYRDRYCLLTTFRQRAVNPVLREFSEFEDLDKALADFGRIRSWN